MSENDREILSRNWESMKEKVRQHGCSMNLPLTHSGYAIFGTSGVSVYKYRKGSEAAYRRSSWQRKIINGWNSLTFVDFLKRFKQATWETV